MENPLLLDMMDSPLFSQKPQEFSKEKTDQTDEPEISKTHEDNGLDMSGSLLFLGPQDPSSTQEPSTSPEASEEVSSINTPDTTPGKEVKLFNGKTIKLRLKPKKFIDPSYELGSSDELSLMDMDNLFQKAKERQALKENQALLKEVQSSKVHKHTSVWTEKYRPKRYMELCSAGNDKQYRMISHWLKKWSSIVHHEMDDESEDVDLLGRPLRKFLLVNGPSGIGKTAAVHIIAKQLGYNVEELNASNSMDVLPNSNSTNGVGGNHHNNVTASLKLKIQNALTSNSIQSQGNKIITNSKPTCLVIDEIDTAGNSSDIIRVLNELNQSDQRALRKDHNRNVFENNSKSKGTKKDSLLTRPIICIANDVYGSNNTRAYGGFNMDKLRSMSELVTFRKPTLQKSTTGIKTGGKALKSVKEFIKWISEKERLKLDYQEISEIVEICEGDIRACINHLQFSGRKPDTLISDNLMKLNKDSQISWFKLAEMLFKRDPHLSKENDFERLMNIILDGNGKSASSSSGTLDKVVKACFNKYLDSVHFQDDSLTKPCIISDWLDYYDRIGNNNEISHYSSLVTMKFWLLFSEINPQKVNKQLISDIKNLEFESYELKKFNKSTIKRFISNIPINLKLSIGGGFEDNESFGLYFLPMIYKLLSPDMISSGSSNSLQMKLKSALSKFDQICLEKSAFLSKDFGINLESLKDTDTNQVTLEINPNIDSLVLYNSELSPNSFDTSRKQIQMKRRWFFPLLQRELERVDMINRSEKRKLSPDYNLGGDKHELEHKNQDQNQPQKDKRQKITNSIEFFKGQYEGISTQIQQAKDSGDTEVSRIWVRYNEGFSNAVRKNIGWNDLWIP